MKTKGISFWEQNIERLVLGIALVVCLALVAMQFLGEPNAVSVAGKTISPGDVDQLLKDKAATVDAQLSGTSKYEFPASAMPVLARLDERMTSPVVPSPTMFVAGSKNSLGSGGGPVGNRPFNSPKVPQATALATNQFFDTIQPEVVEGTEGLKTLLGATAAPYDVTWNTVSAKFPVSDLLKQYSTDDPNGAAAFLLQWYNNRVDFIDLKLEREEYVDGNWVNPSVITPLPGYFSFRVELKDKTIDDSIRNWALSSAVDPAIRAQIIQPPFYGTLTESWVAPGGKDSGAQNIKPDDPAAAEKQERAEVQKRLNGIIKSLKDRGCPDTPPAKPEPKKPEPKTPKPKSGGGGGGGAAPGEGAGGDQGAGMSGGTMRGGAGGAALNAACEGMWARRKKLEAQLAQLDAEIAKIEGAQPVKAVEVVVAKDEAEPVIDIWAHDLSITPGKTYRYRITVEVYNPLFGRKLELIPEQQPLAERFTLSSEPSEWSEAITAQPPLRLFVTQAFTSTATSIGMPVGQATAEVYRFHNGRWWAEPFRLSPGSRVGDTKASQGGKSVDYGTDWFVLDVVPVLGADPQDEKNGYGAMVLLQSLSDPNKIEWRSPRSEYADPDRKRLIGRVKLSDLDNDAVASAGKDGPRAGSDSGGATN